MDPTRLDVAAWAAQAGHMQGVWPVASLPRLADAVMPVASQPGLTWSARAELLAKPGRRDELWLAVAAEAVVELACQRCLAPMEHRLTIDQRLRFVADEAAAASLDAEIEEDVLALTRSLDLRELIEDELLLALPLVPRHEACPVPLQAGLAPTEVQEPTLAPPHPFAALRALVPRPEKE